MNLQTSIQYLKGIGPQKAKIFEKLQLKTLCDLILYFPISYQDRTKITKIKEAYHLQESTTLFAKIGKCHQRQISSSVAILDIELFDSTGIMYARFYRKVNPYAHYDAFALIKKHFEYGKFAYVYGNFKEEFGATYFIVDDYEIVENRNDVCKTFNKIVPIYALTQGLKQKTIRQVVSNALSLTKNEYPDISEIIGKFKDIPKMKAADALEKVHYPQSLDEAELARRAFALQEFFVLETALCISRRNIAGINKIQRYSIKKTLLTPFRKLLPFEFTKEQKKVINEIFKDMQDEKPMNRLLMGDVGSGKTIVALSAVLLAIENGYQAMIIVPTEILAKQHFNTVSSLLKNLNINCELATSSIMKRKTLRNNILENIKSGKTNLVIGTHSLIEDRIQFKNLSLIVIDEQHRFGVLQKSKALDKAQTPDILMMTATPIPRALSMTVYGEMDISTIEELPPGRIPVKTYVVNENVALSKTIQELKNGGQAYIVYPLIDESDKVSLKSAVMESEKLSKTVFNNFKVGLLHGKMKAEEKNQIMIDFKDKKIDVLIATTVIEVGIDVPNATVMIINNADRFGLSALHQLRGRIGRGKKQSYCYLIGSTKGENAFERLSIMAQSNNGFEIAQKDLQMRGPGEFMGTLQHGFMEFKAGNLVKDTDIIEFSKQSAKEIIETDPKLENPIYQTLKNLIISLYKDKLKLTMVG